MSIKIKTLGFGLLAAVAVSVVAVVDATASGASHFTSEVAYTSIVAEESGTHQSHFKRTGASPDQVLACDQESYTGTVTATTVTSITITPSWSNCTTTNGSSSEFNLHENGCFLTFTIGTSVHNKVHLVCPNKAMETTHPNCNITVPAQSVGDETIKHNNSKENGVVYTTDTTADKKHSVTMDVTIQGITTHYHSFGCQFIFGTTNSHELFGSITIRGTDTVGNNVNITATGN